MSGGLAQAWISRCALEDAAAAGSLTGLFHARISRSDMGIYTYESEDGEMSVRYFRVDFDVLSSSSDAWEPQSKSKAIIYAPAAGKLRMLIGHADEVSRYR